MVDSRARYLRHFPSTTALARPYINPQQGQGIESPGIDICIHTFWINTNGWIKPGLIRYHLLQLRLAGVIAVDLWLSDKHCVPFSWLSYLALRPAISLLNVYNVKRWHSVEALWRAVREGFNGIGMVSSTINRLDKSSNVLIDVSVQNIRPIL